MKTDCLELKEMLENEGTFSVGGSLFSSRPTT